MGRTFVRQDTQVRNSDVYDDTIAAGAAMEAAGTHLEQDLNSLRSQAKRAIWADTAGNWFDDIQTVNGKKRALTALNTDLDDLEEKRLLFRAQILTDIVIPAGVAATGTITAVAGASLIDGETFTLNDGVNPATVFEFDSGGGVGGGNVAVAFTGGDSAATVKASIIAAINGVGATLLITASDGGGAVVNLTHDRQGTVGNQPVLETVANGGFVVTGMSGGAGDIKVLVQASAETPSQTIAADAGSAEGALVSVLATDVGSHSLVEIAGPDAISPKNLCLVRDAVTGDPVMSDEREVYALIQAETGVLDGDAFNDTNHQAQLSFVRINSTGDDLEAVPGNDIGGLTINYSYVRRNKFDNIPETAFLTGTFLDQVPAATDVTLDIATDNQVGPVTQVGKSVEWRIDDTFKFAFQDSTGAADIWAIKPSAGGDEVEFNGSIFDINNTTPADFNAGASFATGSTQINVGVSAGVVESVAADLRIFGASELFLDDGNQTGSTWAQTSGIKLSDTTAEWDAVEVAFGGEVSILRALGLAKRRPKVYATVTANATANTDVGGVGGGANLDAQLPDMSLGSFLVDYDVYLNGSLQQPGADAAANNDYYPGTSLANGQLRFEFNVKIGDIICVIPYTR